MPKTVLSLILGGGKGTRLHPLTSYRSKPAVPLAGKYRLVDIPISNCLHSLMNRIFVLTQFNSASLHTHIKNTYTFDIFSKGFVDILAAEQTYDNLEWYQGTADAVRQSFAHFEGLDYDYMLILSGDQLYQMDFREMLDFHKKNNADISIAALPVHANDATGFGIMHVDKTEKITNFIEKPKHEELEAWKSDTGEVMMREGREYLASMGIYLFSRKVIKELLFNYSGTDFGGEIIPASLDNYNVYSYQFEGYWTDIGTIRSFFDANLDLVQDIPKFNLYSSKSPIYTRARMLPPAKVRGCLVEKALIADGCIVFAKSLSNVIVGIRTRIGENTFIENSYIMGNDFYETIKDIADNESKGIPAMGIGHNCILKSVIVDKNARIGNNVRIIGGTHISNQDNEMLTVIDGIIVIKKDAVVPHGYILE